MKIAWVLFFLFLTLYAQSGLSLADAIAKVKQNNQEINIAKFDEQIKDLEHQMALGQSYGSLDLTQLALRSNDALSVFGFKLQSREATFSDFGFKQLDMSNPNYDAQPNDLNYPKDRNLFQTAISYSIPIYTGGKLEQYGKITEALKHLSTLDRQALILQKICEVKKNFYTISLLKTYLYNLNIIAKNITHLERTTQAMLDEGYAKKVDLLEVQARLADVERQILQTKANQSLVYYYLSFLVDEPVTNIIGDYETAPDSALNKDDIISENLDIKKAEQGVAISKMKIALQESAFLPQVGAFAQYGSSDDTFLDDFEKHDAYTAGIQIKWNLFNGGSDKAGYEKAHVENLKAEQELQLAQKRMALHVKQLQTHMQSHEYEIASLKKEVEVAHLIYDNYAGRYAQKLVSINDVMLKQSEELKMVLKLKEVQNARNDIIFELEKIAAKETK